MIETLTKMIKNKNIRNRILFTLMMLFVYRLGSNIPAPNVNQARLTGVGNTILQMMNLLGGGQLERFSIFALGVGPYITASIITQLLAMDVIPYFADLQKEGEAGRKKMDRMTRYLALVLGFIQSISMLIAMNSAYGFMMDTSAGAFFYTSLVMVAGTMFLLWVGDQITSKGIGNGLSIIIMAGIVSGLPNQFMTAFTSLLGGGFNIPGLLGFIGFVLVYLVIIVLVIYMNQAERRIPIQYTSSSVVQRKSAKNYLPLKINSASVIPVIFSQAILTAPLTLMSFFNQGPFYQTLNKILNIGSFPGLLIYALLIILFTFFYTHLTVDPDKISKDLAKNGTYITSIRPGEATRKYISTVLNRITVPGAIFLLVLALLPYIVPMIFKNMPAGLSLGGTGMIIVVGVALETMSDLTSKLTERKYEGFRKSR